MALVRRRRTDPKAHKKEFCAYHLFSLPVSEEPGVDQKLAGEPTDRPPTRCVCCVRPRSA